MVYSLTAELKVCDCSCCKAVTERASLDLDAPLGVGRGEYVTGADFGCLV